MSKQKSILTENLPSCFIPVKFFYSVANSNDSGSDNTVGVNGSAVVFYYKGPFFCATRKMIDRTDNQLLSHSMYPTRHNKNR